MIVMLEGSGWFVDVITKGGRAFYLSKGCKWKNTASFFKTEYSAKLALATYRFGKPLILFQEARGWYVYGNGDLYLHNDGEWRIGVRFRNELSGYFQSKKEAKNAFANCSVL